MTCSRGSWSASPIAPGQPRPPQRATSSAAPGARARLVALAEATVGDESPGGVRTFVRVMHAFCAAEKPGKALPALVDAALGRAGQLGSIALSFARLKLPRFGGHPFTWESPHAEEAPPPVPT